MEMGFNLRGIVLVIRFGVCSQKVIGTSSPVGVGLFLLCNQCLIAITLIRKSDFCSLGAPSYTICDQTAFTRNFVPPSCLRSALLKVTLSAANHTVYLRRLKNGVVL